MARAVTKSAQRGHTAFQSAIAAFERPVRRAFLGGDEGDSPVQAVWTFSPDDWVHN